MKSKPAKKTAPQSATKKVFDVTRPGKMPVSPTSRPVIVGHKPQVKDPMMSDRDDERPLLDSSKKVTIAPASSATPAEPSSPVLPSAAAASTASLPAASPATDVVSAQPDSDQDRSATQRRSLSGEEREPETAATAPEVPEAEKPAEPSTANSVATIATSSVVDDVPPPQEDTTTPKPTEPLSDNNSNSGLVFDDLDGTGEPNLTKPSPVAGDTDAAREPTRSSEALATQPAESESASGPVVTGQAVVSHHKQSGNAGKIVAAVFVLLVLAIIAFDVLLDMGILNMTNLPHTNFLPNN